MHVLTVGGEVEVSRPYFWSKGEVGVFPADTALGIDAQRVSKGAMQLCCTMGVIQDFAQGARDLRLFSGLGVSKERLRQITESQGQRIAEARKTGDLKPAWSAAEAHVEPGGPTRVYTGVDGVMVRTVTQEEKDKRRKDHAIRRQQRGRAEIGNIKPLPKARPGSDDRFKEMKIGLFYDQGKTRVHAFATEGNHEAFGKLLRQHADAIELEKAQEALSLTDGGPWIRNQILQHLKRLNAMLLDFFHLSEHIWSTAKCCLGDGPEAKTWAEKQLHEIKHVGARSVLAAIDERSKKMRSKTKKDSLRRLRQYIVERWEMVEYPQALAKGWDIGSGPTEAMCKNLTLRLKRTGMKWDANHAGEIMNLVALRESGQWDRYWESRKIA